MIKLLAFMSLTYVLSAVEQTASAVTIDWTAVIIGLLGSVVGASGSALVAVFVSGRWQGRTDQRIDNIEDRLESGRDPIQNVPVLRSQIQQMGESIDRLERVVEKMNDQNDKFVTQQECERRHKDL